MTNLDLISAIGAADARDLEHSERRVGARRHIGMKVLAAAAMIALLSTSVLAAPAIQDALFGAKAKPLTISGIFVDEHKSVDVREAVMDVTLDVRMDPAAPDTLETCYVPLLPAEQWEIVPLTVTTDEPYRFGQDDLLQWKGEDGRYLAFRQSACPDYDGHYSWDSVCIGFDADYTIRQQEFGGCSVQRIIVEPSAKDAAGVHAEHPGLQTLYWSDGFYIFSMEVNYSMTEEELAAIFESIEPVQDVYDYVKIEYQDVKVTPPEPLQLQRVLYPAALPEELNHNYSGYRQPNGEYMFLWRNEDVDNLCVLELSNGPDGRNHDIRMTWETFYIPDVTELREVNGTEVRCYENGFRAQITWRFEDMDYTLKSSGPARLGYEKLLEIMQQLVVLEGEDIDAVLTNVAPSA